MSAAVHLVDAAEVARGTYRRSLIAVCGELVSGLDSSPADSDPKYCPECVRAAASWNARE